MESLRRVALHLHALAPGDQRWMLRRLPAEHGPTLRAMLRELKQLGIPKDPGLADGHDVHEPMQPSAPVPENGGNPVARAKAAEMGGLLRGEPREVVGAVLKAGNWGWKEELLQRLEPAERKWLGEHSASANKALPPAVRECLIVLLEQALAIQRQSDGDEYAGVRAENRTWWKRLTQAMPWQR